VETLRRPDLTDLLVRLGLRTLGDLAALPRADLAARFGPEGERAHRLASGLDEQPRGFRRPPPDLRVAAVLDPPATRVDVAAFAAKSLADGLAGRLAALGLACTRLRVEAATEREEALARVWRHEDGFGAAAMVERVRWQLEGWLASRPGAIARLALVPDEVVPGRGRQLGFWGEEREAAERAARGLARVQGLLGAEAVSTPGLRGGRGPADRVTRTLPLGAEPAPQPPRPPAPQRPVPPPAAPPPAAPPARGAARPQRAEGAAPWPGRVPAPAPAAVHPVPLPAELLDGEGAAVAVSGRGLLSARPARLWVRGAGWAAVTGWAGPWPLDERWWDPAARRRLARLQVLTADGAAYLLARSGGRWWVEATYD
jgi:protein ImuB